jgi:peptidoglycan/LPS O-acetylase OafA/YrhL
LFVLENDPAAAAGTTGERDRNKISHQHILELDGFRAIAILWVLLLHFFYGWAPMPPNGFAWVPRILLEIVSHGWLGVDLFFILSGFLITGILIDARSKEHYFRNFYARRSLRILPLYWICILVMGLTYGVVNPHARAFLGISLLFLANFAHALGVRAPHGPGVFWSLAVEEHFYLLWPLLVRFMRRSTLLVFTLLLVIGSPILRGYCAHLGMDPEKQIYVYSYFRFDGLALGAILAMWVRSKHYSRANAWKLAGLLVGISLLVTVLGQPFGLSQAKSVAASALRYTQAQFVFAAAMAMALAYRGTGATAFLRSRFAKVVASLSYCLYLIHLALGDGYYRILHWLQFNDVAHFGIPGAVAVRFLVIGTAAFGLAMLSKKYVEDPILKLKRYF